MERDLQEDEQDAHAISKNPTTTGLSTTKTIAGSSVTAHTFPSIHYTPPQRVMIKPRRVRAKPLRALRITKPPSSRRLLLRSFSWTVRRSTLVLTADCDDEDDGAYFKFNTPRFPARRVMPSEVSPAMPDRDAVRRDKELDIQSRANVDHGNLGRRDVSANLSGSRNARKPSSTTEQLVKPPYMMRVCLWIRLNLLRRDADKV